MMIWAT